MPEHKVVELLMYIVEKAKTGHNKEWIKNLTSRAKRTIKKYEFIIKENKPSN
jgi:ribulose 1,5-bisphosphate carboxylase large subunit-like protein